MEEQQQGLYPLVTPQRWKERYTEAKRKAAESPTTKTDKTMLDIERQIYAGADEIRFYLERDGRDTLNLISRRFDSCKLEGLHGTEWLEVVYRHLPHHRYRNYRLLPVGTHEDRHLSKWRKDDAHLYPEIDPMRWKGTRDERRRVGAADHSNYIADIMREIESQIHIGAPALRFEFGLSGTYSARQDTLQLISRRFHDCELRVQECGSAWGYTKVRNRAGCIPIPVDARFMIKPNPAWDAPPGSKDESKDQ